MTALLPGDLLEFSHESGFTAFTADPKYIGYPDGKLRVSRDPTFVGKVGIVIQAVPAESVISMSMRPGDGEWYLVTSDNRVLYAGRPPPYQGRPSVR